MNDISREILYSLGFLSSIAFASRMLLQWLNSETKKQSVVTPLFWQLSLCGNLTLALHAFIQVQFHVFAIQVCNAVISWRNLNLMQPIENRYSKKKTIQLLITALALSSILFTVQVFLFTEDTNWFRIPMTSWQLYDISPVSTLWHLFGFFGLTLFSSRFWIQWWYAEKYQQSTLSSKFWWASLIGESICLIYFFRIQDPVNYIGPLFGLIPCIRNLMLINKYSKKEFA